MKNDVQIYAEGLFYLSACAPDNMTSRQVQAHVRRLAPCGTAKGWTVSKNATFADDKPMPCTCDDDPARQHWLLEA